MIGPIEPGQLERILEINAANVPDVGQVDRERLQFIVDESSVALSVVVDGEVAGFCLVLDRNSAYDSINYQWFIDRYDDVMYLDRVAFDERFRGRGLGTELYAEVDRIIRRDHPQASALTLEVNVDPPNDVSLRFHDRLGFVEVGRQVSKGLEVSLLHRPIG